MKILLTFVFWWFCSLLALAQKEEPTRLLAATYYSQALEQAVQSLVAGNVVFDNQVVEYRAGKSVVLTPGFEAKIGSVFAAHTDYIEVTMGEGLSDHLLLTTYPNPFIERTTITYQLTNTTLTSVFVRDSDGKLVSQLINNEIQQAGRHEIEWRAEKLPAGSYICTLEAGKQHISSRVIIK